ncbi:MAG: Pyruvate dehydrogenase complex repressor [Syntrophorhabdus sp. PtaU1.Bin058]|nr:MAG: Pyruvate dehydrogenase complex repressor [Syntrophorhabdus sp. PtaU1.Bin058]
MVANNKLFSTIQNERVSNIVEKRIRKAIFDNHFKVGDKIPSVREFAETFGVSRTTIQEALRGLEKSGLIVIKKGATGGSFVMKGDTTSVTDSLKDLLHLKQVTLQNIADVRLLIEPPICAMAAEKITDDDIERLEQWNQELKFMFQSGNPNLENDPTMHTLIAQTLGNPLLTIFVKTLMEIHTYKMSDLKLSKKMKMDILNQHQKIIEALKKRRGAEAAENMREHISSVREYLLSIG